MHTPEWVEPVLVVDLDGTLIRGDLLHEAALLAVIARPASMLLWPRWLAVGKAELKRRLAEISPVDADVLPYREDVLAWLRGQRAAGRRLVLATASHRRWAEAVAAHLGLFDEVLATESGRNLKAEAKRDALVERYGPGGFDYVGDSDADLPVWEACRTAYLVGPNRELLERLRTSGRLGGVLDATPPRTVGAAGQCLRPHQWAKNLLVWVPLLTAHLYGDLARVWDVLLAFVAFSLVASSLYIVNDLLDLAADRRHRRKRSRPLASGRLSLAQGVGLGALVFVGGLALAGVAVGAGFTAVLGIYASLTLAYSGWLKRRPVIDVLLLAAFYTLRIVAGAVAIGATLSLWLLSFSMFLFLSLALLKRYTELLAAQAARHKGVIHGRGYRVDDAPMVAALGAAAGYLSVMVLALFIQDAHTLVRYPHPEFMWLACPLLLFWISRAWLIGHRGQMHDDPVVFALSDRASWLTAGLTAVCFGLARYGA